ncbi:MAG: hypothetical protein WB341_11700 [Terracidiphilus sp.]
MKKLGIGLIVAIPMALFCWAGYLILSAPPEPAFDWRLHMSAAQHDAVVALLNHLYTRAAYTVTWAIQLGYVAWLCLRWRSQKRQSAQ